MNLTNKAGLPDALVRAVSNDSYSRGDSDISTTQLIDSPLIRQLRIAHANEITEDVSDRIWALLGQSVHTILERANLGGLVEQRVGWTFEGRKLSGQFDHLENGVLTDYKVTSVWSVIYGKSSWEDQLNVLAYLCSLNSLEVNKLQIVAILRDWQQSKSMDENYPKTQVVTVPVALWDVERQDAYIRERLAAHFNPSSTCSDAERWKKEDTWAVMKKGRKSALRVLGSEEEAKAWMQENGGDEIQHRPGSFNRCESYCSVRPFCPNY